MGSRPGGEGMEKDQLADEGYLGISVVAEWDPTVIGHDVGVVLFRRQGC